MVGFSSMLHLFRFKMSSVVICFQRNNFSEKMILLKNIFRRLALIKKSTTVKNHQWQEFVTGRILATTAEIWKFLQKYGNAQPSPPDFGELDSGQTGRNQTSMYGIRPISEESCLVRLDSDKWGWNPAQMASFQSNWPESGTVQPDSSRTGPILASLVGIWSAGIPRQ